MVVTAPAHPSHPRRWWVLVVLCFSLVLVVLDNTVTNVALPTLSRELAASGSELQWIVDSYVLVFGALLLTAGAIGDRFGRRGALQAGLAIVGLSGLAALLVDSAGGLIAVRLAMGVGAAFVMPATLSIIMDVFPPEERGRAMGIWSGLAGAGAAIGLLLGGWLLDHFAWQSVFTINAPIAGIALLASALVVPTSKDPSEARIDVLGTILSIAALASLLYAVIEVPARGWSSPVILSALAASAFSWGAFILWELRARHPMLPMGLFRERAFATGSFTISLVFFALFSVFFVLSQYMQFVRGFGPFEAGVRFLPLVAGIGLAAPTSDLLVRRIGARRVVALGLVILTLALAGLSRLGLDTPYALFAACLVGMGLGMGNIMAPATNLIMSSVPQAKAGIGSAMNDTTREVGGALGIAVLGSLLAAAYAGALVAPEGLPAPVAEAAADSLPVAFFLAEAMGGETGAALEAAARAAFVDALRVTFLVGAGITLAATAVVVFLMPRETRPATEIRAPRRAAALAARPGAFALLVVLLAGMTWSGGALGVALVNEPEEEAFAFTPPTVLSFDVAGSLTGVAGAPGLGTEGVQSFRSNMTEGHAWAVLGWGGPGAPATLTARLETRVGDAWVLLAEGTGPAPLELLSEPGPLGEELRLVVAAAEPGLARVDYGGTLLVASPEVPLPPPSDG